MEFGKSDWRTFESGIEKEWLLTNGIGGFASSTIIGANTRRYHGLLTASLNPPVNRHLILSKIDESIRIDNKWYNLYSFKSSDYIMRGFSYLQRVVINPLPTFIYNIGDVFIEKKICMVYGENTVVVLYRIINGSHKISLNLTPLVNFRHYHHTSNRKHIKFKKKIYQRGFELKPYNVDACINIYCGDGVFIERSDCWFIGMHYPVEAERGLDSVEDHHIPGYFKCEADAGEEKYITIIATLEEDIKHTDGLSLIYKEEQRIDKVLKNAGYKDEFAMRLVTAADQFIVHRKSTGAKTIIAGYPWFADWGRDTMISLTGLTLVTKRFDDAKQILLTFSRHVKDGLVPNLFPDEGQQPVYNSVDSALWYFESIYKYARYTNDYQFIRENIYSKLKEIINAYSNGTNFNIKMDEDYLISAGDERTQLTWMDAKVDDWVVTPRHGKAVEINALWYNALNIMSMLAEQFGEDGNYYRILAEKVKNSFIKSFWNASKMYLCDVVNQDFKDDSVRPNQIIAVSLSFPVIKGEMAKKVVEKIFKELYTSYGLRSLSPTSDEYAGVYAGDRYQRDGAYHQGTVWTWLLGHFITAYVRVNGYTQQSREMTSRLIDPFKDHMRCACIGSISEIFDGDQPLTPRGCFAQAWSVAEILRAYIEDVIRSEQCK